MKNNQTKLLNQSLKCANKRNFKMIFMKLIIWFKNRYSMV